MTGKMKPQFGKFDYIKISIFYSSTATVQKVKKEAKN